MTFEEFIAARLGALVRYATVVTWDPHLAEDIIQDVLIRAQARHCSHPKACNRPASRWEFGDTGRL